MSKRYLLYLADAELSEPDIRSFEAMLRGWCDPVKVIPVKTNQKAVIVKTSNRGAATLREGRSKLTIGGKFLGCVLTSGAIGNLKRCAKGAPDIGKIPQ